MVGPVRFTVSPTNCSAGDTTTVYLAVACLNDNRSIPLSEAHPDYPIRVGSHKARGITTDANLLKFLDLVKNKPGLWIRQHSLISEERLEMNPLVKIFPKSSWPCTRSPRGRPSLRRRGIIKSPAANDSLSAGRPQNLTIQSRPRKQPSPKEKHVGCRGMDTGSSPGQNSNSAYGYGTSAEKRTDYLIFTVC